jgi:hypothetical protein
MVICRTVVVGEEVLEFVWGVKRGEEEGFGWVNASGWTISRVFFTSNVACVNDDVGVT